MGLAVNQRENHSKTARDGFLDFVRGAAIFLVLWGHCIQYFSQGSFDFFEDKVFMGIYSFHMPLFMFLSGYLFFDSCRKRNLTEIIFRRMKGIGIPLLAWSVIKSILELRNGIPASLWEMAKLVKNQALTIWFLWAVLVSSVLVAIAFKIVKNDCLHYLLMIIGSILVFYLPGNTNNMFVYPYFVFGFAFKEFGIFEKKWYKKLIPAIIAAWAVMLCFFRRYIYIYISGINPFHSPYGFWGQMYINIFRFAIGFFGLLSAIEILRVVFSKYAMSKAAKAVEAAGQNSLKIYVMQIIFLEIVISDLYGRLVIYLGRNYLTLNMLAYDLVFTVLAAIACVAILLSVAKWICKLRILNFLLFGQGEIFERKKS